MLKDTRYENYKYERCGKALAHWLDGNPADWESDWKALRCGGFGTAPRLGRGLRPADEERLAREEKEYHGHWPAVSRRQGRFGPWRMEPHLAIGDEIRSSAAQQTPRGPL